MTKRREFPKSVRVAVIKRATKDGVLYCEKCGALAKRFQIDHMIADAHGGKPVIENAELICEDCYSVKNPKDTTIAAKLKRVEARHIGAVKPKGAIANRPKEAKPPRDKLPIPPRRSIYATTEN